MTKQFIYGQHAVLNALSQNPKKIQHIYLQVSCGTRFMPILRAAENTNIPITEVEKSVLDKYVADETHQGVVAEYLATSDIHERDLFDFLEQQAQPPFLLILDGVQDPHNLGACLRSAEGAGVTAVIIPKDRSATVNATVRKVACGAAEHIPVITVTNLARILRMLKEQGIWLYGAAIDAPSTLYQLSLSRPLAMILGAEHQGLRRLTRECCDVLFHIPMQGQLESLNVSVATGIALFEVIRQNTADIAPIQVKVK